MPIITLPDGSKKVFEKSVTILDIAQSIGAGLAKATIAGKVNDVLLDATTVSYTHLTLPTISDV